MKFVADLHIHSHYSRATSKDLNFEHLTRWAQLKGVHVVGTGDVAHPGWLAEMREKLEPAEEGLFRLKEEYALPIRREVPAACHGPVRFMLGGEISNIYKKYDKVRKIHNVVFLPSLESVAKLQVELEKIGNIRSDGRPILGLDSRDLFEILLEVDPEACLIPAHIWTPWFALFGSMSGFDSVEECFEDLTPHIFALETGLSSDPPMNSLLSALDRYTLVSNSDAHSPQKLGREANLFDTDLSYPSIFTALRTGDPASFPGTIEFFPEEGKYHYDGHRKCEIRWNPATTKRHGGICTVCGRPVTVGVMHRVASLADRKEGDVPGRRQQFKSLVPLPEILAEINRVGASSLRVRQQHELLLARLGPELSILQNVPIEDLERAGGSLLAEGIRRMRSGEITVLSGYDGEYGTIKLFEDEERDDFSTQVSLFAGEETERKRTKVKKEIHEVEEHPYRASSTESNGPVPSEASGKSGEGVVATFGSMKRESLEEEESAVATLNTEQDRAARCTERSLVIVAGPGTGKTSTVTHRIAHLVAERGVPPEQILAITFTNKASGEMATRLSRLLGPDLAERVTVKTFHAFGAAVLRAHGIAIGVSPDFSICSQEDRRILLRSLRPALHEKEIDGFLDRISSRKNMLTASEASEPNQGEEFELLYADYERALGERNLLDFDDLILQSIHLFENQPAILATYRVRFRWISVDEYQDVNPAQYRLLKLLAGPDTNLCVIGDPDQAIYGFRGANREYFFRFGEDFPNFSMLTLNRNYRSIRSIIDASRQVISREPGRESVAIWSDLVGRTTVEIHRALTGPAEAEYIVHQIEKMVGGTSYFSLDTGRVSSHDDDHVRPFSDFAVLYRLGALSGPLIEAFDRSGIPFQTVGRKPLHEYREIQEILSFLWLMLDPGADFHREKLESFFARRKKLAAGFGSFVEEVRRTVETESVAGLIGRIVRFISGEKGTDDDAGPLKPGERVERLTAKAAPFGNRLRDFLEAILLGTETDEYDPRADRVTLMTLHSSKGLEFPVVFIVGCEERLIPYHRESEPIDIDEERRLLYVGMTRAKERLILTHAERRLMFGQTQRNEPSRFLGDIEEGLKEITEAERRRTVAVMEAKEEQESGQMELF